MADENIFAQRVEEKTNEIEKLFIDNIELKGTILSLETGISRLKNIEKAFEEYKNTTKNDLLEKTKKINELIEEIHNNDKNIERNINLTEKNNQIIRLTEKIQEYENQLLDMDELKKKILISKQELAQFDQTNQQLEAKIAEKNKCIEELSIKNGKIQMENEKLLKEKDIFIREKEILILEHKNLAEKSSVLSSELQKAENKYMIEINNSKNLEKTLEVKEKNEENMKNMLLLKQEELNKLQNDSKSKEEFIPKLITSNKINILPEQEDISPSKGNCSPGYEIKKVSGLLAPRIKPNSKYNSFGGKSKKVDSETGSLFAEGYNIVPSKIIKAVSAANKR